MNELSRVGIDLAKNVFQLHSGVSPQVGSLCRNNKSTRYAAFLQLLKHQIRL